MITYRIMKKINFHHQGLLIFIFLLLATLSLNIYKDYGISLDEEITRNNGLVSIKYIVELFFPQYASNFELIQNIVPPLQIHKLKSFH